MHRRLLVACEHSITLSALIHHKRVASRGSHACVVFGSGPYLVRETMRNTTPTHAALDRLLVRRGWWDRSV